VCGARGTAAGTPGSRAQSLWEVGCGSARPPAAVSGRAGCASEDVGRPRALRGALTGVSRSACRTRCVARGPVGAPLRRISRETGGDRRAGSAGAAAAAEPRAASCERMGAAGRTAVNVTGKGPPYTSATARAATSAKRWRTCSQAKLLGTKTERRALLSSIPSVGLNHVVKDAALTRARTRSSAVCQSCLASTPSCLHTPPGQAYRHASRAPAALVAAATEGNHSWQAVPLRAPNPRRRRRALASWDRAPVEIGNAAISELPSYHLVGELYIYRHGAVRRSRCLLDSAYQARTVPDVDATVLP
jgi:hypothetical protein